MDLYSSPAIRIEWQGKERIWDTASESSLQLADGGPSLEWASDPSPSLRLKAGNMEIQVMDFLHERAVVQVPAGMSLHVHPRRDLQAWDLSHPPSEDSVPLVIRDLMEGMDRVRIPAGGQVRLEWFQNETAYLSLHHGAFPITPGDTISEEPLPFQKLERWEGKADSRKKVGPGSELLISGEITGDGGLILTAVEGRSITLNPGESGELLWPNGSKVQASLDAEKGRLQLLVSKGMVRIRIPDLPCWSSEWASDQQGWIQWKSSLRSVDLGNTTPSDVFAPNQRPMSDLSHGARASTGCGAVFQYTASEDCRQFRLAAWKGQVEVHHPEQEGSFSMENTSMSFSLATAAQQVNSQQPVRIQWEPDGQLVIPGSSGDPRIPAGSTTTLSTTGNIRLNILHPTEGPIQIRTPDAGVGLIPNLLEGWTFNLPEGGGAQFTYQPTLRSFSISALADNTSPMTVVGPQGFSPMIPPGGSLNFILGDRGPLFASGVGNIFFMEASGGDTTSFGTSNLPGAIPSLDTTRISQPNTSTFLP